MENNLNTEKKRYDKKALEIKEQIEFIKNKNLNGLIEEELENFLRCCGYYNFKGYFYIYLDENKQFKKNVTWHNIKEDYAFDQEFKLLLFKYICIIEKSFKSAITNVSSVEYGNSWYVNKTIFKNEYMFNMNLLKLENSWENDNYSTKKIKNHFNFKYPTDIRNGDIPSWILFETCSFGVVSKIYSNFSSKSKICDKCHDFFNLKYAGNKGFLHSWIKVLVHIRNVIAHDGKLIDVHISDKLTYPALHNDEVEGKEKWVKKTTIFSILCVIKLMLKSTGRVDSFLNDIDVLINKFNHFNLYRLGFPENWQIFLKKVEKKS